MVNKKFLDNSVNYNNFINKDFRSHPQPKRHPGLRWLLLAVSSVVLGVVIASTQTSEPGISEERPAVDSITQDIESAVKTSYRTIENHTDDGHFDRDIAESTTPQSEQETAGHFIDEHDWRDLKVRSGDSLSLIFLSLIHI